MKRRAVLAGAAGLAAAGLARPAIARKTDVLRFVPQANLANPDPIWTTATVAWMHGFMVWDALFGIDTNLRPHPQMLAGYELSQDQKVWRLTLRDGLAFHDGEPVRGIDCITSIHRWGRRDPFGQTLMAATNELKVVSDKVFEFHLKKPFPQLPYALGSTPCLIMPERIARTDPFKQVEEYVGSGPFRFLRDEWLSGARAVWAKNDKYVPRQEPPSYFAGGKVVHFDRVEWKIMPDPATASAALQQGEVDWWENPLMDLVPSLKRDQSLKVFVNSPLGALGMVRFNQLFPPFDNVKLRQALIPVVDENEYMAAVLGDLRKEYGSECGFFTPGSPYASLEGMQPLLGKRDPELAKKLVAESGYKGEPVLLMSPSDQPQIQAMAQVTDAMFKSVGINSQFTAMDWGTLVERRASKEPPDKGGWNVFCTTWGGLSVSNPGSHYPLRGNGRGAWFGWPNDPEMETLRSKWFDTPDLEAQQQICVDMQKLAMQHVPFLPTGEWFSPTAHRTDITGVVKSGLIVFWGVRRV